MKKAIPRRRSEIVSLMLLISLLLAGYPTFGRSTVQAEETSSPVIGTTDAVTEIYLDGVSGSDTNDGLTVSTPVKTFAQAKTLAESYASDTQAITIYVLNTVSISGDISLSGINAVVKRYPTFAGNLMSVARNATAALSDITIDGNSENVTVTVTSSLVASYGTLTIEDGAVLQNNVLTSETFFGPLGGAVYVYMGTLNMTGGEICYNTANFGGGIYGASGTLNISGGVIHDNQAVDVIPTSGSYVGYRFPAAGGGICIYDNNVVLNLSGTAQILNNSSEDMGGGISVGLILPSNEGSTQTLNMTGGTVSGNTAGSAGGGIFIQGGHYEGSIGIANISGGTISDNTMDGTGLGNTSFGGGGIYVNGSGTYYNGVLNLTNALITDNTATLQGGGYAACPISVTNIYANDGAALYGNTAASAYDIYILASNDYGDHSGDPTYDISATMLGGSPYHWNYDDGTEVPYSELTGTLDADAEESLSLYTDGTSDAAAEALATVLITGNTSATRGGGIGSNGTVNIGTASETVDVTVSKLWEGDESTDRPASIIIDLYRSTEGSEADPVRISYETMTMDSDGSWPALTFADLPAADPDGKAYVYTVAEEALDGYAAAVTGSQEEGYTITNTKTVSVSVTKVWSGGTGTSVLIHLYADGTEVADCELTADNDWQYTFTGLPETADGSPIVYTISEDAVSGYTTSVTGSQAEGFTVTNTRISTSTAGTSTRVPVPDTSDAPAQTEQAQR